MGVAGKRQGQGCPLQWEGGSRAEATRVLREGHLQKGYCWSVPPPPHGVKGGTGLFGLSPLCHFVDLLSLSIIEQMAKICKKFTVTRKVKAETLFFFQENLEK